MAIIGENAGTLLDCGASNANTGDLGCKIAFGFVKHGIALIKGTIIPKDTDLDLDYINTLIQDGKAIPVMDAYGSEPTFSEDTLETSPLGVETLTLLGLPKFMLTYKSGQYFYKQLARMTNFGNYEWILGDAKGNWKLAVNSNGDFKGFDTGQTIAMMTTPATATETEKKSITFQLINRNEYDINYRQLDADVFFPIYDVKGVNGVSLAFEDANGAVPPAATDATLKVKVVFSTDNNTTVSGLVQDDFAFALNGVSTPLSGVVEDGAGYYTLTLAAPLASLDVVEVAVFDSLNTKDVVITSGGVLLRTDAILEATVA